MLALSEAGDAVRFLQQLAIAALLAACGGDAGDACTSSTPGVAQHCAKLGLLVCEVDGQSFCAVEPEAGARCCR